MLSVDPTQIEAWRAVVELLESVSTGPPAARDWLITEREEPTEATPPSRSNLHTGSAQVSATGSEVRSSRGPRRATPPPFIIRCCGEGLRRTPSGLCPGRRALGARARAWSASPRPRCRNGEAHRHAPCSGHRRRRCRARSGHAHRAEAGAAHRPRPTRLRRGHTAAGRLRRCRGRWQRLALVRYGCRGTRDRQGPRTPRRARWVVERRRHTGRLDRRT